MALEQVVGAAVVLVFLADVFLTVLYARAGTGLLAPYWNRAVWTLLWGAARLSGQHRGMILSFAGPVIVVLLIGFWALGLSIGAALIIQPELGTAIRPPNGDSPTDFVTALLVAGNSLSIVGSGNYSPQTTGTRLLFLINSLIGASTLSLVLSYLVQVYSGLRERNALALSVHLMTDASGDSAEMLARLVHGGESNSAISELANLSRSLVSVKEAHHFYPLLFYFRFKEPYYSVSRFSFVILDLVTLIETALDNHQYKQLIGSSPVLSLRRCALLLLETIDQNFPNANNSRDDTADNRHYRQSYTAAIATLSRAGVSVQPHNVEQYVTARREWDLRFVRLAPKLGYAMEEVDRRNAKSPHAEPSFANPARQ